MTGAARRPEPWSGLRARDVSIFGKIMGLPPLCRPGGWVALWRRLAMVGALNARGLG